MKRIILILLFLLPLSISAQTKKQPGEVSTINWTYSAADEPKITGFRIYSAPSSAGPFTLMSSTAPPSARSILVATQFPANSTKVYYQVKAFFTSGATTLESAGIPATGVEVALSCKCQ